jgi:bis(5'-nucleosyl)-tetraphosphatase (symmetrical)
MAVYAVGDIQGCYDPLRRLLDKANFDPSKDTLYCVGDLVNRGPSSAAVLRFLKSLENSCVAVLGNHDIHLLSMYYGIRSPKPSDTMLDVLNAPDAQELCDWVRGLPFLSINKKRRFITVHAGIYPWWSLEQAQSYAKEIQNTLRNEAKCKKMLEKVYGNKPSKWDEELKGIRRKRFIMNAFTRMRFCSPVGHLNLTEAGYQKKSRKNRIPWFKIENKLIGDYKIVFGHWSALGLVNKKSLLALDTGCVWGNEMTLAKIRSKPLSKAKIIQSR